MTGKVAYNHLEFEKARKAWTQLGHDAVTPFEANSVAWRKVFGRDFDPYQDKCDWGDPILPDMIAEDLKELLHSDAVVVLDGWRQSKGSRTEVLIALNVGKPIYSATTHQRLHLISHVIYEEYSE